MLQYFRHMLIYRGENTYMDQIKTGELISKLRKQHGFTQRQLAEQLHVSITAVCKWETGVSQS